MKQKILYVMDPLCGWSYGNSSNFLEFYEEYRDVYDFEIIVGGIKTDNGVSLGGEQMTNYIRQTGAIINKISGAIFSEKYFENLASNPEYTFDSRPPSKAIVTVRFIDKKLAIPFADRLQQREFVDGKNINDDKVLARIASEFGIDTDSFLELYNSELVMNATNADFRRVRDMNVDSFPSIYISLDGHIKNISNRYMTVDEMKKAVAFCYVIFT